LVKSGFQKVLLEAVDEALSSLGDSPKRSIYFHLDRSFKIKRREIPRKIRAFADAMEKTFGFGAKFIETAIMERLYEKVGGNLEVQNQNFLFADYVDAVQNVFEGQN
jgi:hypothetical protein